MAKWFKPRREVGYSAEMSARENVVTGRRQGYSYLTVGRQLGALANEFEGKSRNRRFSEEARRKYASYARRFRQGESLAYTMHAERS